MNPIYQNIPQNDRKVIRKGFRLNQLNLTLSLQNGWAMGYYENKACLYNAKTIFVPKSIYFLSKQKINDRLSN
jgi:hypothetical protein